MTCGIKTTKGVRNAARNRSAAVNAMLNPQRISSFVKNHGRGEAHD